MEKFDDYQQEAIKTMKPGMSLPEMNKYFAMKFCEESGEVSGMLAKHYVHDRKFDSDNLKEELSDLLWNLANMAYFNGFKLSEIAQLNIEKLRKRHGESYNGEYYK